MTENQEFNTSEKIYTLKQAAEEAGLSTWTLNRAVKDGHLQHHTVACRGGFKYMIPESALFDWIEHRHEYYKEPKPRRAKEFVARKYSEMDISELAGELLNRIKEAYQQGYEDGMHNAKVEFLKKLNEVGGEA